MGTSANGKRFTLLSASRKGRHVQWETVPPEEKSGTLVAWVASGEETKRMKPTDKAILGMVSESPGRNASEPEVASTNKNSEGRALYCRAKAAWRGATD